MRPEIKSVIHLALFTFCENIERAQSIDVVQQSCSITLATVRATLHLIKLSSVTGENKIAVVEHALENAKEHLESVSSGRVVGTYSYHLVQAHRNLVQALYHSVLCVEIGSILVPIPSKNGVFNKAL